MQKKSKMREKGTGTIFKKGNHFYLKMTFGSRTKTTTLRGEDDQPVTTRKDAEAAAARLRPILRAEQREEIALHVANARKLRHEGSFPVEQIWNVYLEQYTRPDSGERTLKSYANALHLFTDWLTNAHPEIMMVNQITEDEAGAYFAYLWNKRNVSGRTFNSYRQALRLIFNHILEPAGLDENPFAHVGCKPIDTLSRLAFTETQVKAIFDGFHNGFFYNTEVVRLGAGRKHQRIQRTLRFEPMYKDEMRVLLMLCCWTGCRGQDGCLMRWSNVDLEQGTIAYVPRKTARKTNNHAVSLPLHPELAAALHDALVIRSRNKKGEDYILPSVAERYQRNPSGVQEDVQKIIQCAIGCETTSNEHHEHRTCRANLYSLHSFRHTFVSFCANAGVPLDVVASIVGHSSSAMTRHYAHISDDAKKKAVKSLPDFSKSADLEKDHDQLLKTLQALPDAQLRALLQRL